MGPAGTRGTAGGHGEAGVGWTRAEWDVQGRLVMLKAVWGCSEQAEGAQGRLRVLRAMQGCPGQVEDAQGRLRMRRAMQGCAGRLGMSGADWGCSGHLHNLLPGDISLGAPCLVGFS